jgi:hypothetical protein
LCSLHFYLGSTSNLHNIYLVMFALLPYKQEYQKS